jgi:hypothetical protein
MKGEERSGCLPWSTRVACWWRRFGSPEIQEHIPPLPMPIAGSWSASCAPARAPQALRRGTATEVSQSELPPTLLWSGDPGCGCTGSPGILSMCVGCRPARWSALGPRLVCCYVLVKHVQKSQQTVV